MDLLEIGAIAQVLWAVAILLSLIFVIIELRKNLKQNNIANTLQRAIEWEKILYKQMEGDMAKVIVKARESYECLEEFEKVQFEAFVQQRMLLHYRGFRTAEESAFLIGAEELRDRIKAHLTDFFASPGVCECYKILVQRDIIRDEPWLKKISKIS